jgi:acetylornithine deacetylase/succinyl-diaminopimelate desuccinylase-like protein
MGHPDSRVHAPDENIRVDLYLQHAKHVARLLEAFGAGE